MGVPPRTGFPSVFQREAPRQFWTPKFNCTNNLETKPLADAIAQGALCQAGKEKRTSPSEAMAGAVFSLTVEDSCVRHSETETAEKWPGFVRHLPGCVGEFSRRGDFAAPEDHRKLIKIVQKMCKIIFLAALDVGFRVIFEQTQQMIIPPQKIQSI